MEHYFKGITPEEKWKNELLDTLRAIRELLSGDAQAPKTDEKPTKRPYQRRGGKP